MSTENEIAIAQHAQNNIVIAGDHNTVQQFIQYVKKELTRYPYKFLSAYDLADRDIFFGRNAVIEELVATIPRHKVLLINGASGAGKSSLLNAGVIPHLTEQGYRFLTIRDYTDPLQQLRAEFIRQQWLAAPAVETGSLTQMLRTLHQQSITLLLVFDQFEQFFLQVPYATRQAFLQEFKVCLGSLSVDEMNVVFAIRRDFLGQMLAEFEQVISTSFSQESKRLDLYPLSKAEAREAIMNPLKHLAVKIGYDKSFVEDILLTRLLEQTSDQVGIEPPHLQIVCNQLYETAHRRLSAEIDMVQINAALYDELGGVEKILQTYLDEVVKEITADKPAKIAVIRSLLKAMIETSGTRRFISVADLQRALPDVDGADIERFLGQLQDRRVLETRQREGEWQFSLSHEIMVAQVASWYDEREWERKRAEETLERGLKEWASSKTLLNEKQFSHIRQWLPQVDETAQKLLVESERSNRAKRRNMRLLRASLVTFVVLAIGFGILSYLNAQQAEREAVRAEKNAQEAERQKSVAEQEVIKATQQRDTALRTQSLFLADLSWQQTEQKNAVNGMLLALEGLPKNFKNPDRPFVAEAHHALYAATLEQREVKVFLGHESYVRHAAFSPDGQWVVTASWDNTAKVWDTASGKLLATLAGHEDKVEHAAFSSDGQRVVTASNDNTAKVWEVASGQLFTTLAGHKDDVDYVAFSPDGQRVVTASNDNTAKVWEVASGKLLATLAGHENWVTHAEFSPDGKQVVTASADDTAKVWEVASGKLLATLAGHESSLDHAAFSPDGQRVVTAGDRTAKVWEVASGKLLVTLAGHENTVTHAAFSPDGQRVVTASWDKTAKLWEVASGKLLATLAGHQDGLNYAAFSPDGQRVVTAGDRTAKVWEVANGKLLATLAGHESYVNHAAFSPDGQWVVISSYDNTARVWEVASSQLFATLAGHQRQMDYVVFSPDGQRVVVAPGNTDTAKVWEVTSRKLLATLSGHERIVTHAAFNLDGQRVVTASGDKTAKVWEVTNGRLLVTLAGHEDAVAHAAFSPNGQRVVTASYDKTAKVWEVAGGQMLATLSGHEKIVTYAAFSPDGQRVVTASVDGTAKVWEVASGKLLATLVGHEGGVKHAAFSPDGQRVVTTCSYDKTAKVWEVASGKLLATLAGHESYLNHAAFSPDGQRVVTASKDGTAKIWRVFEKQELIDYARAHVPRQLTKEQRKQFFLE